MESDKGYKFGKRTIWMHILKQKRTVLYEALLVSYDSSWSTSKSEFFMYEVFSAQYTVN